ncbi:MAG: lipopolysaccharide transport periplasmic protein LptA [Chromatiales bacterium]|nr:lipopolysaccharide transport periplasmic protein LptA [Chromatiales bacterium]
MVKLRNIITAVLLLTTIAGGVIGQAKDALELEADSVSYNNRTGVAIYRGNVKISQGDITLEGDMVEVHTVDDKVSKLIATANPSRLTRRDQQQTIAAEAQRIEYKVQQGIVDFLGQVKIKEESKLLTGDYAIYDIEKKTVNMQKKKNRVRLIIQPETEAVE